MAKKVTILMLLFLLGLSPQVSALAQDQAAPPAPNLLPWQAPEPEPSGPFPDAALGIWSAPDCTDAQSVLVLSRYYQMHLKSGRHMISAIRQWRSEEYDDEKLFFYLAHDGRGFFFKMTNDGLFKHLMHFVHPKQELHTAWNSIIERMSDEYTRCAKLFTGQPVMTQEEVNLPFLLDKIREPCAGVDPAGFAKAGSCHAALFAAIDSDRSEKLDAQELAGFYKQAVFLESGTPVGCRLSTPDPALSAKADADAATGFAAEMLRLGDSDHDNGMSMGETGNLLANPLSYSLREPLLQKLRSARFALGFLPLSNAEKSCTAGSGGGQRDVYTGIIILEEPAPGPGLGTGGGCGCGG